MSNKKTITIDVRGTHPHQGTGLTSAAIKYGLSVLGYKNVTIVSKLDKMLIEGFGLDIEKGILSKDSCGSVGDNEVVIKHHSFAPRHSLKFQKIPVGERPVLTEEEKNSPSVKAAWPGADSEYSTTEPAEIVVSIKGKFRQMGKSAVAAILAKALEDAGMEDVVYQSPLTDTQAKTSIENLQQLVANPPEEISAAVALFRKHRIVIKDDY